MTLKELGELLRAERERKSLSLKQVMESTKISRRILVALEEGDRKNLPHPVYAKGFVRNYARILGLDDTELAAVIDQEFDLAEEEERVYNRPATPRAPVTPPATGSGRRVWPTVLLIVVLVLVLVSMVVYLQRRGTLNLGGSAPATTAEPSAPAETPPAEPEQAAEQAAVPAPVAAPAPPPVHAPESAPAPVAAAAPAEAPKEAPSVSEQVKPAPAKPGVKAVSITAKPGQMCWMEVSVDGREKKEYFIRSGEAVNLEYSDKLWVRLGNVGGVTVTHNGKAVATDGAGWSVKTLTFP
ncbi:MAG TPA: helix-turn-helix domain-containing protein [Desulfovibrio sp.]|uniref:helix-turn-helix domain-containing protein n=1 Tax=Desulfovibrio TaxID=872 RepID=UPI0003F9C681|nr:MULTISPECIES: helix-turn-helix domain-containing protein [Desulfovibrio]HMM37736.1 helix-turn-helix domain-containing protein [Desulfovibrio sp.]